MWENDKQKGKKICPNNDLHNNDSHTKQFRSNFQLCRQLHLLQLVEANYPW